MTVYPPNTRAFIRLEPERLGYVVEFRADGDKVGRLPDGAESFPTIRKALDCVIFEYGYHEPVLDEGAWRQQWFDALVALRVRQFLAAAGGPREVADAAE